MCNLGKSQYDTCDTEGQSAQTCCLTRVSQSSYIFIFYAVSKIDKPWLEYAGIQADLVLNP